MKAVLLLILASIVACGCATTQPVELPDKLPHLIEQEPFPPMSEAISKTHLQFDIRLQVAEDGSVSRAQLLDLTGDPQWDSIAQNQITKWKFSPAVHNGKAISMWVNIIARVKFQEPLLMRLAEIVCPNQAMADSLYGLLRNGQHFDLLAASFSIAPSKDKGGDLGTLDLCRYGEDVRRTIARLHENGYTEPIALGERFVIFKRLSVEEVRFQ